jgi:hypothetical protein
MLQACEAAEKTLGAASRKGGVSLPSNPAAGSLPRPLFVLYMSLMAYVEATAGTLEGRQVSVGP